MPDRNRVANFLPPLALNVLAYEDEGFHVFFDEAHEGPAQNIDAAISESLATAQAVELDRGVPKEAVLMGFHLHAGTLDHEVAMVAWTEAGDDASFRCIAATTGTTDCVALPQFAARPLAERAERSIRTSVLLLHNHPSGPIRNFVVEELGLLLGPSSDDRRLVSGLRDACTSAGGHVSIEGWLLESEIWRPVRLAPAETIAMNGLEVLEAIVASIDRATRGR